MLFALTFAGPDADAVTIAARKAEALAAQVGEVKSAARLGPGGEDVIVEATERDALAEAVETAVAGVPVDACLQAFGGRRKRLFLADMDSTIIGCEGLDELADYAGVKAEVAAVTERAMRGEIAFEGALRQRVAKLAGLPVDVLAQCLAERVRLNPGARTAVRTMAAHGACCVLVSGGFQAFSGPVARMAGFKHEHANRLLEQGGRLTGMVADPVLGREAKLETLQRYTGELGLGPESALAVGDGANDLAMIQAAGLGVAYRAKPLVATFADARLDHSDLTALLYFQGYRVEDFVCD